MEAKVIITYLSLLLPIYLYGLYEINYNEDGNIKRWQILYGWLAGLFVIGLYKYGVRGQIMENDNSIHVDVCNGKYTVVFNPNGGLKALRYGEKWRDCCGDNLIFHLASELDELRKLKGDNNEK